jgi:hypothetical protein
LIGSGGPSAADIEVNSVIGHYSDDYDDDPRENSDIGVDDYYYYEQPDDIEQLYYNDRGAIHQFLRIIPNLDS